MQFRFKATPCDSDSDSDSIPRTLGNYDLCYVLSTLNLNSYAPVKRGKRFSISDYTSYQLDKIDLTYLIETSIIANIRYFPSSGTTRDVGGIISTTSKKNTWRLMRIDIDNVTWNK
ncbi:hypothetical protein KQX54_006502 [Cotesia glomerata]|uniref:Uncharacterized protein n=1 Tax=Cotesia glomerata TaxID=32391 RepID=A0AAV7IV47_COTGL|nr:hypothetical protein KQX54_006502 [Cotesia glomerata]